MRHATLPATRAPVGSPPRRGGRRLHWADVGGLRPAVGASAAIGGRSSSPVTPLRSATRSSGWTDEDQAYFRRFADYSQLDRLRASIQSSCEILYNVQAAEEKHQQERRDSRLNSFFAFLTALTLVSVVVDSYAYVRDEDPLLVSREIRSLTLVLLLVAVTGFFATRWGIPTRRRPR